MLQFQDEIQEMQSNRPACAKGVVTKEKKKNTEDQNFMRIHQPAFANLM